MNLKETGKRLLAARQNRKYGKRYDRALRGVEYRYAVEKAERLEKARMEERVRGLALPKLRVFTADFARPFPLFELPAQGEEIVLLACADGELAADACFYVRAWFALHPQAGLLYGDEDIREEDGARDRPWLKPAWSPDLFSSCFYLGGAVALEGGLWNRIASRADAKPLSVYELCYEAAREAGGFAPGIPCPRIGHVDAVLFHRRSGWRYPFGLPPRPVRVGETARADVGGNRISVVIPSKDQPEVLKRNLYSLLATVLQADYEVILVDNGSGPENRMAAEKLKQELIDKKVPCKYLYRPMPFDFSSMCNMGAKEAEGELLLFLNDDVEAVTPGWMEALAGKALLPHVGAVGIKLLYPGTDRIQHAGIANLPTGPVHKLQFHNDGGELYFGRNRADVNVAAVTGACLMVRRDLFLKCGGFSPELPVAFNDVDFCFGLLERGYYNVSVNGAYLYHHESLSRGDDESPEKLRRLAGEREKLYRRHAAMRGRDPFYHRGLNRMALDTGIRAMFEEEAPERVRAAAGQGGRKLRLHPGVLVRVELLEGKRIRGYMVMLGDDNACYEISFAFLPLSGGNGPEDTRAAGGAKMPAAEERDVSGLGSRIYTARVEGRFRPDLERNMPDQRNVALAGADALIEGLPPGFYAVGAVLKNKVTGVSYLNWTARRMRIERCG